MIHAGPSDGHFDKMDGGVGPNNVCIIQGGDEITRCNDGPSAPSEPGATTPIDASTPLPPGIGTPQPTSTWLFTNRGRVVPFGDAQFYGDLQAITLNAPVVGSAASPGGHGYSMVQRFEGSLGDRPPATPAVSVASVES